MVLVFSSHSNNSVDVSRELILAANSKLIIIPFKIEKVEPMPGMQYYLARTHWLDAMNPPTREQILTLIETVKKLLLPESSDAALVTPALPPTPVQKTTQSLKVKTFKPWMLWIAILLLVIIAIYAGGKLLGKKLFLANTSSLTSTQTESVSVLLPTQMVTALTLAPTRTATAPMLVPAPGVTVTSTIAPPPTGTGSINVHASPGTILEVPGKYVAWSPDGRWLVIGERQIHFYDPQSLKEVRSIQADRWVNGLAISPDSKVLAAIDETRGVMLFDMATGSELRTLPRTGISTSAASSSFLAFAPDSSTLAVVIGDTVKLFNVANGQETGTIVAKGANAIVFSSDGQNLYAGGWQGITVSNVATSSQISSFGDPSNGANRLALSPDGSLLVSAGSFDAPMVLWDAATGRQLSTFAGHKGGVNSLAFSPDGKLLASSAGDVTIKLWDAATGNLLQTLVGHTEPTTSLAISPDGTTLASTGYNQGVWLWGVTEK
jgi:WD40 repeat protein